MTREEFRSLTEKGIVMLDGGSGTTFMEKGMGKNVCPEVWVSENPEVLKELQKAYIAAGSDIIYASTFGANRERLKGYKKQDDIVSINTQNVALSKEAAEGKAYVAGDMSMTGLIIYPDDDESFDEAVEVYKEQAKILAQAGVDLFVVETMISLDDAKAAVRAIRQVSDLPVMVTMSFETNGRTLYGNLPEDVAEELTAEGADAIGANCSTGPENMAAIIKAMKEATTLPIIAKPNAGFPHQDESGKTHYDLSPEDFQAGMKLLVDAGAKLIGGCCGTTPEYISKIAVYKSHNQPRYL